MYMQHSYKAILHFKWKAEALLSLEMFLQCRNDSICFIESLRSPGNWGLGHLPMKLVAKEQHGWARGLSDVRH